MSLEDWAADKAHEWLDARYGKLPESATGLMFLAQWLLTEALPAALADPETQAAMLEDLGIDGGATFSGVTVHDSSGEHRLTWRERFDREQQEKWEQQKWGVLVNDLDRCQHGRHEGNVCSSCGGPSIGNPQMQPGTVIGHTMSAVPITVPLREDRHRIEAWVAPPSASDKGAD